MPKQFVIQRHTSPEGVHSDLMLEADKTLWTWRIAGSLEQIGEQSVPAEKIADHPLRFLTYEGPVQQGAGHVRIADSGSMFLLEQSEDRLVFELQGRILSGQYALIRKEKNDWTLRQTAPLE